MTLHTLPKKMNLVGKRVLVRVDWNVPLRDKIAADDAMKIAQTIPFLQSLLSRGATVIVFTHLGRPEKRDQEHSTERLTAYVGKTFGLDTMFHPESVSRSKELKRLQNVIYSSPEGFLHVLENTRFEPGEKKNDPALAKAYASLADVYVNDAFASCHDEHVSVAAISKQLPSFAGPDLVREVEALSKLILAPKHPFLSIVGGNKLSTKIPLLQSLLKMSDAVLVGSGHVGVFEASTIPLSSSDDQREIRGSHDPKLLKEAKKLLKNKKLILPTDVIMSDEGIKDTGTKTMKEWEGLIKKAKMIMWNGPVGDIEQEAFAKGTRTLIRLIATKRPRGSFAVVGGGDSVPEILKANLFKKFDHVSMGGGAMLAFIAKKGNLPGLKALWKK